MRRGDIRTDRVHVRMFAARGKSDRGFDNEQKSGNAETKLIVGEIIAVTLKFPADENLSAIADYIEFWNVS
jgi:hypothetical protein